MGLALTQGILQHQSLHAPSVVKHWPIILVLKRCTTTHPAFTQQS